MIEIKHHQFGQQVFDHPSSKDINLSFFKRGFGGEIITLYRGIKYYDKEFMEENLNENITNLINNIDV